MKAFPFVLNDGSDEYCSGMELRDYFAVKAMPLYLAMPLYFEGNMYDFDRSNYKRTAELAYIMADAMMEARNG